MNDRKGFWQSTSFEELDSYGLSSIWPEDTPEPFSMDAVAFEKDEKELLIKIDKNDRKEIVAFLVTLPTQSFREVCKTIFRLYKDHQLTTLSREKLAPFVSITKKRL